MKKWISNAVMLGLWVLASGASLAAVTTNAPGTGPVEQTGRSGTVVETMDAASYTYVRIDTGREKIWAAAPQFPVKVGDKVTIPSGVPMPNYHSKTLNRTFETILFVESITAPGQPVGTIAQDPHAGLKESPHTGLKAMPGTVTMTVADFQGISKPKGGRTVAEVYAQKSALASKQVAVRGKVVKYNQQIMGKNWMHLQDGTGAKGANDLTITTADTAQVGDIVLVTGTLALKKDFGYGYKYELLLEDARVTVEQKARP